MSNGHAPHEKVDISPAQQQVTRSELSRKHAQKHSVTEVPKPLVTPVPPIDWEIPRKILHSSIGMVLLYIPHWRTISKVSVGFLTLYLYLSHGSPGRVVVALGTALAVIVPADILRLNVPGFERVYEKCLGFLMRESEKVCFVPRNPNSKAHVYSGSAENHQWCHMVYFGCYLGALGLSARHCCGLDFNVRLNPSLYPNVAD